MRGRLPRLEVYFGLAVLTPGWAAFPREGAGAEKPRPVPTVTDSRFKPEVLQAKTPVLADFFHRGKVLGRDIQEAVDRLLKGMDRKR